MFFWWADGGVASCVLRGVMAFSLFPQHKNDILVVEGLEVQPCCLTSEHLKTMRLNFSNMKEGVSLWYHQCA